MVLSYGYDNDLQNVAKIMPKGVQTILMSATLTSEVETLKGLFCRNPAILELEEAEGDGEGVSQYVMKFVSKPKLYDCANQHPDVQKTRNFFSYTSYLS